MHLFRPAEQAAERFMRQLPRRMLAQINGSCNGLFCDSSEVAIPDAAATLGRASINLPSRDFRFGFFCTCPRVVPTTVNKGSPARWEVDGIYLDDLPEF